MRLRIVAVQGGGVQAADVIVLQRICLVLRVCRVQDSDSKSVLPWHIVVLCMLDVVVHRRDGRVAVACYASLELYGLTDVAALRVHVG